MREPLKDRERLEHMLMAIDRILRYTKGKTFQDLVDDDMMYLSRDPHLLSECQGSGDGRDLGEIWEG